MANRVPSTTSTACLNNKYLGTYYDDVQTVSENIDDVVKVAALVGEIDEVDDISVVVDNIDDVIVVANNIDDVVSVAANITDVINAEGNATIASTKARDAGVSADEAEASAASAAINATTASDAANNATVSEGNASTSETNAAASANAASTSADLAQKWANNPENAEVLTSQFSAFHWAEKSRQYATVAIHSGGTFTPTAATEYPTPADASQTYVWLITLAGGSTYTYTAGDLVGVTVKNGDYLFYDEVSTNFTYIATSTGGSFDTTADYTVTGNWRHDNSADTYYTDGEALTFHSWGSSFVAFRNRATGDRIGWFGNGGAGNMALAADAGANFEIRTEAGQTVEITTDGVNLNGYPLLSEFTLTPAKGRVPAGGTRGQVLTKVSGTDNDVEWKTGGGTGGGSYEIISEGVLDGVNSLKISNADIDRYNYVRLDVALKSDTGDGFLSLNWGSDSSLITNNYWSMKDGASLSSVHTGGTHFNNDGLYVANGRLGYISADIYPQKKSVSGKFDSAGTTRTGTASWLPSNQFAVSEGTTPSTTLHVGLMDGATSNTYRSLAAGSRYRLIGELQPVTAETLPYIAGFGDSYTDRGNDLGYYTSPNSRTIDQAQYRTIGVTAAMQAWATDGYQILDFGITNERTDEILLRIPDIVDSPYKPEIVVLTVGTNDVNQGIPVSTAKTNTQAICDALTNAGAKVVITPIVKFKTFTTIVDQYNGAFAEIARDTPNVYMASIANYVDDKSMLNSDDIHPSVEGALMLGKDVYNTVSTLFTDSTTILNHLSPINMTGGPSVPGFTHVGTDGRGNLPVDWAMGWNSPQDADFGAGATASEFQVSNMATNSGDIVMYTIATTNSSGDSKLYAGSIDVEVTGLDGEGGAGDYVTVSVSDINGPSGTNTQSSSSIKGAVGRPVPKITLRTGAATVADSGQVILKIVINRKDIPASTSPVFKFSNPKCWEMSALPA